MGIKDFKSASKPASGAAKDFFAAKLVGRKGISQMLKDAPDLEKRFIRGEMWRFTRRVRKTMVKERLNGPPGIKWRGPKGAKGEKGSGGSVGGTKQLGKNIRGWVTDKTSTGTLTAFVKISRLLRVHEDGLKINAKPGKWLIIRDPNDRRKDKIVARVKSVNIPARLGFTPVFDRLGVQAQIKFEEATRRAAVILERRANIAVKKAARGAFAAFKTI